LDLCIARHCHPQLSQDDNAYTLGEIFGHNIVVACLPSGVYGTISATTIAAHLRTTFPSIRFGLMVGIGGVPTAKNDIRLGDVVVSLPPWVLE
jgi:undecaprenyl pyrophosphate phosphatase UppP